MSEGLALDQISRRSIQLDAARVHVAEQGDGPAVILLHGFPEGWYSWRRQIPALAGAGFRAVAPDQRGYGLSSNPGSVEAFQLLDLVADITDLVHAIGEDRAAIAGHDWGAVVAAHCALLRPDLFKAVILLSVPYRTRRAGSRPPTETFRRMAGPARQFYISYFQEPGRAEAELEADVRASLLALYFGASGQAPEKQRLKLFFSKDEGLLDQASGLERLPTWLSDQDLDFYSEQFERTGFAGGLNWYRNMDHNWRATRFLNGALLEQPSLFIGGEVDPVLGLRRDPIKGLENGMPKLAKKVLLPDVGHWLQQESPHAVNQLMIQFLKTPGVL